MRQNDRKMTAEYIIESEEMRKIYRLDEKEKRKKPKLEEQLFIRRARISGRASSQEPYSPIIILNEREKEIGEWMEKITNECRK